MQTPSFPDSSYGRVLVNACGSSNQLRINVWRVGRVGSTEISQRDRVTYRKNAIVCRQGPFIIAIETIAREICNRYHQQIVLLAEFDKVRQTSHGAVVIDDLADHPGGLQASETRQIDCRFCLAAPFENAAGPSAKWKNVAWTREVFWITVRVNSHLNRLRAVVS